MSQAGQFQAGTVLPDIETLTGDSGGAVGPNGAGNINMVGGSNITTVGTPGTNTLTINLDDDITIDSLATSNTSAGLTISDASIVVDGTDADIDLILTGKGSGGGVVITDGLTINETESDRIFTLNGVSITSIVAMHSSGVADLGGFTEERHSDTAAFGAHFLSLRSRGTEAVPAIIQNNDSVARHIFAGYDGTDFALCAEIAIDVDGVPGANDMPGRIEFLTSQGGTQTPVLAMTIDSSQVITLANALTVPNGGTGAATLTDHGVVLGSGAAAVSVTAVGTDGQLLIGATGADPAFAALTSTGSTLTYTTGANTLNIDIAAPVTVANGGTGRTSHTAYAVLCGGTTTTGAQQSIASVGTSGQLLTSNGAGALPTFQDAAVAFVWNEETGTSATMAVDNGYIANNASLVTLTLPTTAAVGSVVRVAGKGAGGWRVAQNAGESINFGSSTTTTGVGGYLEFTDASDAVELLCITADTQWVVLSSVGNITVN
jgi:hypothetical protein